MRKFNWDYLYYKIKDKGYTVAYYSTKLLGKSGSYLTYYKATGHNPPQNMITFMIKDLELDENALWQINETENAVEVDEPQAPDEVEIDCEAKEEEQICRYVDLPRDFLTLDDMLCYLEDKFKNNPTSMESRAIVDAVTIIRKKCSDEELKGFYRLGGVIYGTRI